MIGLADPNGNSYKERAHKQQQMLDYYVTVKSIVKKLSTKRTLYFYDCGCGRSYLSFYLNYFLKKDGYHHVAFIGIDFNADLIRRCQETASHLNMTNMTFYDANIGEFDFPHKPDIVYSLHACDSATDLMIYKGIAEEARFILSVSCCQHTMRSQMKRHPLAMVARHKPYKERLVDMLADSLRTLLLEAHGYKVTVYEFVAASSTPKNVMLKCEKVGGSDKKTEIALAEYKKLSALFNLDPVLRTYLEKNGIR